MIGKNFYSFLPCSYAPLLAFTRHSWVDRLVMKKNAETEQLLGGLRCDEK
jgi:hypothetical protein